IPPVSVVDSSVVLYFRAVVALVLPVLVDVVVPAVVVRGGAYRVVRNPMYVANIMIIVGIAMAFRSWPVALWALLTFVAFHLWVIGYEEPTLARHFGAAYASYRDDVGRWLPRRRERHA